MAKSTATVLINGRPATFISETLWKTSEKGLEFTSGMKEGTIKDNGTETG